MRTTRRTKRPEGKVVEQIVFERFYPHERGKISGTFEDGEPRSTGMIKFIYADGHETGWFPHKSAPLWMHRLWEEAKGG